jgi:RES domain-containing protein
LPWAAGPGEIWRLDAKAHASTWDSGKGAEIAGGRWNPVGYAAVYCSMDPATAILEVAVHKGFRALDAIPHVLTKAIVSDVGEIRVIDATDVPNAAWLTPAIPSRDQQLFGKGLMDSHPFVLIPSAVSRASWNLIFNPVRAAGTYRLEDQQRFSLDTRLNPP